MQIQQIPQNDLQELREYLANEKKYSALENVYHNLISTRILDYATSLGIDTKANSVQFNLDRGTIYVIPPKPPEPKPEEPAKEPEVIEPKENEDSVAQENTENHDS